jgi:CxxC motif-containing protein
MSDTKSFTCIGCPIGCPLVLTHEGRNIVEIEGATCSRGAKYARQEFTDPRRGMSTTVAIEGARWKRLPVKVTSPVPKDRVLEAARLIHRLRARAPVRRGEVLLEDLLGEKGVQVVATRSMERLAP